MPGPLLAVDAPYLLYRSFFALPESIRGVDGHPVGALLGAANALLRAVAESAPRAVVICFGAEAARYRLELYPPYHAHRPPVPDALAWQFAAAPELFSAFGWRCETAAEHEADDLLGSYAAVEQAAGGTTLILTGDRDMYQCVGPAVSVLYPSSGTAGFATVDAAEVRRRYGIDPEQVPDFIALRGDPSDGLPGAGGVGAKTAATLLGRWRTLAALLEAVGTQERPREDHGERPKLAATLRRDAAQLRAFASIATLQPLPVGRPPDAPTDRAGGAAAAASLGLANLAGRQP